MKHTLRLTILFLLLIALLASAALAGAQAGDPSQPGLSDWALRLMRNVRSAGEPIMGRGGLLPGIPPTFGTDVRVSFTNPGRPHNETAVAINPTNPMNAIAGANDYRSPSNTSYTGYYFTTNGGVAWAGDSFLGPYPGGTGIIPGGDPVIDYDLVGNAYFVDLGYNIAGDQGGIYIHKSTNGGANWATPVRLSSSNSSTIFHDKPWLAADHNPGSTFANRVYASWTRFSTVDSPIYFSRSTDGGATWSTETPISGTGPGPGYNQFSNIAVARNGTVYISWDNAPAPTTLAPVYHQLVRSTNGGVNWTTPITTNNGAEITLTGFVDNTSFRQWLPANTSGSVCFRHDDYSVLAVDVTNADKVYKMWTDGRWDSNVSVTCHGGGTGKHADIAFNYSTDGGMTWSAPMRVNDDAMGNGRDQWFPWMTITVDGTIHAAWYDRRDDASNVLYRVYYAQSTNGGVSWSANQAVADVGSDPAWVLFSGGDAFIGDYSVMAAVQTHVIPSWTDTRSGTPTSEQRVYVDNGVMAPTAVKLAGFSAETSTTPYRPTVLWLVLCLGALVAGFALARRLQPR